jgi:hypothetical protein
MIAHRFLLSWTTSRPILGAVGVSRLQPLLRGDAAQISNPPLHCSRPGFGRCAGRRDKWLRAKHESWRSRSRRSASIAPRRSRRFHPYVSRVDVAAGRRDAAP